MSSNDVAVYFDKAAERVRSRCGTITRELTADTLDIVSGSEKIHDILVEPLFNLLDDPNGWTPHATDGASDINLADAEHIRRSLRIRAVGIHSAGDLLPSGRRTTILVASKMLKTSAWKARGNRFQSNTKQRNLFLALFNYIYSNMFGRQDTLVHWFLHGTPENRVRVVEVCMSRDKVKRAKRQVRGSPNIARFSPRMFGDAWRHIVSSSQRNNPLKRLVKLLWDHAVRISRYEQEFTDEYIHVYGQRLIALMQKETDTSQPWYCISHTLEKDARQAAFALAELKGSDEHAVDFLSGYLPGQTIRRLTLNKHDSTDLLLKMVRMYQLFFLYREFCGDWFYVFVPETRDELPLKACLTIGTSHQLEADQIRALQDASSGLWSSAVEWIQAWQRIQLNEIMHETQPLNARVGRAVVRAIKEKLDCDPAPSPTGEVQKRIPLIQSYPELLGLPAYLAFSQRVSEVAIHEGKKLKFDILVAGGDQVSASLAMLSHMPQTAGITSWAIAENVPADEGIFRKVRGPVISSILGNHAFLQQKNVVLLGSRTGRLLGLAEVLGQPEDLTSITRARDCYLLRVRPNGDLLVYYADDLVLWRRNGTYICPTLYGQRYRAHLVETLRDTNKLLPSENMHQFNAKIFAEVVWMLSEDPDAGGTFVVGNYDGGAFPLKKHTNRLSAIFPYAENLPLVTEGNQELLKHLASQDGAVLIDRKTGCVRGRRQLQVGSFNLDKRIKQWNKEEGIHYWREHHKVFHWGTRHYSSLVFSEKAKNNAAVITISQDGNIHVFINGQTVETLTYPSGVDETET